MESVHSEVQRAFLGHIFMEITSAILEKVEVTVGDVLAQGEAEESD